jgi:hypothetical protein
VTGPTLASYFFLLLQKAHEKEENLRALFLCDILFFFDNNHRALK